MYCISNASATVNIGMTSGALIKDVQYIIDSLATIGWRSGQRHFRPERDFKIFSLIYMENMLGRNGPLLSGLLPSTSE